MGSFELYLRSANFPPGTDWFWTLGGQRCVVLTAFTPQPHPRRRSM
jgi:hypothetical protein